MATDLIISGIKSTLKSLMYPMQYCIIINLDAGLIYKRLLNHRPVIQNEVHYFVKEFEVSHSHCARLMGQAFHKINLP